MKFSTKLLALLLVALMLAASLVACIDTTGGDETTTAAVVNPENTGDDTSDLYDENGYLKSDLPEELDFGGETITILYWQDVEMQEYEAEEITSELVNDAIYQRNANVCENLGVEFEFLKTKGNGSNIASFVNYVGNIYKGGDTPLDIISSYSRSTALCAMEGYCADMSSLDYLNFNMPWWPESLLDVVPIDGKIYFASGDASINVLHFMYGVYYNKDLIEQHQLENPVELVRNKTWTLEKVMAMTTDTWQDLDGDNIESSGDFFGFSGVNFGLDAFYTGSNLRLVEQSETDTLIISEDFFSEKATNLCTTLSSWIATNDMFLNGDFETPFVNGNVIFIQDRCYLADRKLAGEVGFSYGIVPTPLYNADQEEYISVVGNPFSLYAIYAKSPDANRAAAVLECWASEAYRTTTPAQFEINMKTRYSESSDESEMYNIIRTTVCFDLGRLFNTKLNDITDIFFKAAQNGTNWEGTIKVNRAVLGRKIKDIAEAFNSIEG